MLQNLKILYDKRAIIIDDPIQHEDTRRFLIVTDLHIGFEDKFKLAGIRLEAPIDRLATEIGNLVKSTRATDLILNGDVKSSINRISRSEWENVPKFFQKLPEGCKITVVKGNHDVGLNELVPPNVEIIDNDGLLISDNLIIHGHTKPLFKFKEARRLIIGHAHPIYQEKGNPLSGRPVWVLLKVPKSYVFGEILNSIRDSESSFEIIVMPSFNLDLTVAGYAQETARDERRNAPILRQLKAVREAMVVTLDGELIGDSSILSKIL